MIKKEKQHRDALLLELRKNGFINDSTESEIAFKLGYEKAINYSRSSLQLKDKEKPTFEQWMDDENIRNHKDGTFYISDERRYVTLSFLINRYNSLSL